MECPECGDELSYHDTYGKTQYADHYYIYPRSWIKRTGDIYHCPNREGFEEEESALEYAKEKGIEFENWEYIVCESACFNGFFYTDCNDNLKEGYPC